MGTFQSFRKAYGALKDSTTVGLAKVNSEFKDLDIAIVKATNHVELPPKERHVRKILSSTSAMRPRADVVYCIHAFLKRLFKTKNWIVALKTLIVIHRTLREGDPTFREELVNYSTRGHILQISNFKDDTSPLAWDCSAWARTYALFLGERLECFRVLKYDIESERLTKTSPTSAKVSSRTRMLGSGELIEQLPALQQLLFRLIGCKPEGAAFSNYLIQYALALVLKESFKVYCAINDGIINLVDMFFDMSKYDAVKALSIYKRASQQAEHLADFYEYCKGLDLATNFQFPTLRQPPPSFLATMEEYIREAPHTSSVNRRLEFQETNQVLEKREEPEEDEKPVEQVEEQQPEVEEEEPKPEEEVAEPPPLISTDSTGDLLGLSKMNPKAIELEESNALALAILPHGHEPSSTSRALAEIGGTSGWELALVTTPSNNTRQPVETKLAGGFDKLLLDSLYEDETVRRQLQMRNAGYGSYSAGMALQNPFDHQQMGHDPFTMSNGIAPPPNVQMALMQQQEQQMMFQQQQQPNNMAMVPHGGHQVFPPQYPQQLSYMQQQMAVGGGNPFGDPFLTLQHSPMPQQGNQTLI